MVREFVDRVFDGAAEPLVAHLVSDRDWSAQDRDEIRRLLDGVTSRRQGHEGLGTQGNRADGEKGQRREADVAVRVRRHVAVQAVVAGLVALLLPRVCAFGTRRCSVLVGVGRRCASCSCRVLPVSCPAAAAQPPPLASFVEQPRRADAAPPDGAPLLSP